MRKGLHKVADHAADFLESLSCRPPCGTATPSELFAGMDRPFPEEGAPATEVIEELVRNVENGLIASAGPRYFGFVVGGATRAGLMADWLTSAWDQNAQVYATSPVAAIAEQIVERWLLEMLALPKGSSVGFVTGCQMANFTALSVARNAVLEKAGWNLDERGLFGAPPIRIVMSDCGHATIRSAARLSGFGTDQIRSVSSDSEGRIDLVALEAEIRRDSGQPLILSLQAGNVNTGAFEPVDSIADLVEGENVWIHVDGAFGLWAAVSPKWNDQVRGWQRADSWSTDAHKWLNAPNDSGLVVIKDSALHQRFKTSRCDYAGEESAERRDGSAFVPENSRRGRAFVLYAVLRELGRSGVQEIVERCCSLATSFATEVQEISGAAVLNEVVLNQVLIRFESPAHLSDVQFHHAIASHVQRAGHCWLGTTSWQGAPALRVSICNWSTSEADVSVLLEDLRVAVRACSVGCPDETGA